VPTASIPFSLSSVRVASSNSPTTVSKGVYKLFNNVCFLLSFYKLAEVLSVAATVKSYIADAEIPPDTAVTEDKALLASTVLAIASASSLALSTTYPYAIS
jgi:hypothetical protein